MTIYNVTIKITSSIQASWLEWLKQEHIPDMLSTGCVKDAVIHRLLEVDDNEGPTYSVRYSMEDLAAYQRYIEEWAPQMRQKSFDKWGDRFIAFRSVMEVVN